MAFKAAVILCFFMWLPLQGQNYVSPKKVTTGLTTAIEIQTESDLMYVRQNIQKFYGVQKVRVNGALDISRVANILSLLDDVQDVQMVRFTGYLSDEDLLKMEWVENLTFFLKNGHEDKVLLNNNLGKLNGLTLVFEVAPDDYFFLKDLQGLKSLTLIAPFVKTEAERVVNEVSALKNLRQFGISLDRLDHLPENIRTWKNLDKITVIDNLSWILEKYTENLPLIRRNIQFPDGNKTRTILLEYFAQDAEFYPWDLAHLATIWPQSRLLPYNVNSADDNTNVRFSIFSGLKKDVAPKWSQPVSEALIPSAGSGEYFFVGNTEKDEIFYIGDNAAVLIPAAAFKMLNDSTYHGNYGLRCWWLNSPAELFTKGVNLNFDSSGKVYQIAPDALLSISAANKTESLDLRPGYFAKIIFRSRGDSMDRFYAFGGKKQTWKNYYNYDYDFDDTKNKSIDFYSFYAIKNTAGELVSLDNSNLERRFHFENYFYLLNPGEQRISIENHNGYFVAPVYNRVPSAGAYTLKRGKSLIGIKKEYVDRKAEPGIIKFRIFDKTGTLFPELKVFEDYIFEISSDQDPREFSAQLIKNSVYSDVRIEQVGGTFEIWLRSDEGIQKISLLNPSEKYKGQPKARFAHNEWLRKYNRYREILSKKNDAYLDYMSGLRNAEISNARTTLFFPAKIRKQASAEFRVRSMGTFVWGKPVFIPDTFNLIVKFTDAGGIPLDVKRVYIAHEQPFSYITYTNADQYHCMIDPQKLVYIACVDFKGRVMILTGSDFRALRIQSNSFVYLPMNELPVNFKNDRELERILGVSR